MPVFCVVNTNGTTDQFEFQVGVIVFKKFLIFQVYYNPDILTGIHYNGSYIVKFCGTFRNTSAVLCWS